MASIEELEIRIDSIDDAVKLLTRNYAQLSDLMIVMNEQSVRQQEQLDKQDAQLKNQQEILALQQAQLDAHHALIAIQRTQLNGHQTQLQEMREQTARIEAQTEEIKRDNQKMRRIWIAIFRKMDWMEGNEDLFD